MGASGPGIPGPANLWLISGVTRVPSTPWPSLLMAGPWRRGVKARAELGRLDAEAPARMAHIEAEDRARMNLEINGSAAARTSIDGGAFRFDIEKVDGTDWHVQAYRVRTDLREGATYSLHF